MDKYKQAVMSIAMITMLFTGGLCSGYGNDNDDINENLKARRVGILETFENNDFNSWKKLINKNIEISKIIDQKDFNSYTEARRSLRKGDYDTALSLINDLEINLKNKLVVNFS